MGLHLAEQDFKCAVVQRQMVMEQQHQPAAAGGKPPYYLDYSDPHVKAAIDQNIWRICTYTDYN
jgi:hypothetical protein